jgi:hypothetical protein
MPIRGQFYLNAVKRIAWWGLREAGEDHERGKQGSGKYTFSL